MKMLIIGVAALSLIGIVAALFVRAIAPEMQRILGDDWEQNRRTGWDPRATRKRVFLVRRHQR